MHGISYKLSAEDQAQVKIIAYEIYAKAEPLNRQAVSRYGRGIFKHIEPTFTRALDYTYILYHFPGVAEYIHLFVADDDRITAFENAVALRVHLLTIRRGQPAATEVEYVQP